MYSDSSHLTALAQAEALASPVRQTIWQLISILQPVAPRELQDRMGLERHALYYHLRLLEECELVTKSVEDGGTTSYTTKTEAIIFGQQDSPEWREMRSKIALTSLRRLTTRLDGALREDDPTDGPRRHFSGFLTLFLNDEGRQLLRDRLNQLWEDLVAMQHAPKKDEKPYFLGFGFAPESYGHD
ncbi:MAG: helix-turn-helix domain-containing protein [Planctomycetota bacterium]